MKSSQGEPSPLIADRSAWPLFLASLAGLAALAALLPGPRSWSGALAGGSVDGRTGTAIGGTADTALLLTAGVLVWALLLWGATVGVVAALGRLPGAPGRMGRRVLRRIAPAVAGRLIAATVGVAVLAGTSGCAVPALAGFDGGGTAQPSATSTAAEGQTTSETPQSAPASIDIDWPQDDSRPPSADPTPADQTPAADSAADPPPAAVALPDEPATVAPPDMPDEPAAAVLPTTDDVTVTAGDTLWSIAARRLPADASPLDIDTAWRTWYSANRPVIGADPDLILPGQHLLAPTTTPETSR